MSKTRALAAAILATATVATAPAFAAWHSWGSHYGHQRLVLVKKYPVPSLHVGTSPRIPKVCTNPLTKGPGAKKCG